MSNNGRNKYATVVRNYGQQHHVSKTSPNRMESCPEKAGSNSIRTGLNEPAVGEALHHNREEENEEDCQHIHGGA